MIYYGGRNKKVISMSYGSSTFYPWGKTEPTLSVPVLIISKNWLHPRQGSIEKKLIHPRQYQRKGSFSRNN